MVAISLNLAGLDVVDLNYGPVATLLLIGGMVVVSFLLMKFLIRSLLRD